MLLDLAVDAANAGTGTEVDHAYAAINCSNL